MQLLELAKITVDDVEELDAGVPKRDIHELLNHSSQFFSVFDGGLVIALGGLMPPSMISSDAYVWMVLRPREYDLGELREGVALARNYLSTIPWTVFAEIAKGSRKNRKFAEAVGFRFITELDSRDLFKWSE